jgi:putative acetyltransferase
VHAEPVGRVEVEVAVELRLSVLSSRSRRYTSDQTFGYSPEQLEQSDVYLVAARVASRLVGVAGVEVQGEGLGELKRFFVTPEQRGTGVADALIAALLAHAAASRVRLLRLETGDKQQAAQAFYRRHGFAQVPRFSPYDTSETSVHAPTCLIDQRQEPRRAHPSSRRSWGSAWRARRHQLSAG